MGNRFAKILSIAFHPLLLPSIAILIIFNSGSILEYLPFQAKKVIFLIIVVTTFILPLTFVPFLIFQKIIKSIHMGNHRERLIPFFITAVLHIFSYYLLNRLGAPIIISKFILTAGISVFVLFLLSFKWKVSAHMIGIGGLAGALIALSFRLNINLEYYVIASIVVSGLLGFARLKLKTHKHNEIYIGWLSGFFICYFVLYLL